MSKSRVEELGNILMKQIEPEPKFGSSPIFQNSGKMIFVDKDKEKEWEELEPSVKKLHMSILKETCDKMENKVAIEFLCHVINDLSKRVEKLELKENG